MATNQETMNEKLLERKLREGVQKLGGLALKFTSPSFTGVPDRIILMPTGRIWFAEVKSTGEDLKPRQKIVIPILRKLGFDVRVIDSQEKLDSLINDLQK